MMDQKTNDRFSFKEEQTIPKEPLKGSLNSIEDVPKATVSSLLDTRESRFMFLGEVISDEYDLDLNRYNEAISDKYSENWQSVMKIEYDVYMI